jgi:hypothetical protein
VSPLLPYANSSILVDSQGVSTVVNGRIVTEPGNRYLIKAFLKRQQSSDTETGATKMPTQFKEGRTLPGVSGEYYLYRGYALQYAIVPSGFIIGETSESSLAYSKIQQQFAWMLPGQTCQLRFGKERISRGEIQRSSGRFGGSGIDNIVYYEIGGVELQITGAELLN